MTPPKCGFPQQEFEARTARAQALMAEAELDALLLTTEPDIRYFTGFLTRFWESPTRPWFLILPASSKPVAVIPSIGAHLMGQTWIDDIRTWSSPDLKDDGIGLLIETLGDLNATSIGTPKGPETHLRKPRSKRSPKPAQSQAAPSSAFPKSSHHKPNSTIYSAVFKCSASRKARTMCPISRVASDQTAMTM